LGKGYATARKGSRIRIPSSGAPGGPRPEEPSVSSLTRHQFGYVAKVSQLFVSDLDGTLLNPRASLTPFAREALCRLLGDGLLLTVASARSVNTIAPLLEGVPLRLPLIEFNGAYITDLKTRECLTCHAVRVDIAEQVIRWALEHKVPPFLSTHTSRGQQLYPPLRPTNPGMIWYESRRKAARDPRLRPATDPFSVLNEDVVALTLIGQQQVLLEIECMVQQRFPGNAQTLCYENMYNPGWHWLTVQSPLATKAHALRELASNLGIELANTTAFGDEINDIPMFKAVGRGVAVANAVDALKAVAREVIGPHHEDSVVRYLMRRR
jgi:5-amino-6-(5-phospho-D-ribitylamino)uracil phosphatase